MHVAQIVLIILILLSIYWLTVEAFTDPGIKVILMVPKANFSMTAIESKFAISKADVTLNVLPYNDTTHITMKSSASTKYVITIDNCAGDFDDSDLVMLISNSPGAAIKINERKIHTINIPDLDTKNMFISKAKPCS